MNTECSIEVTLIRGVPDERFWKGICSHDFSYSTDASGTPAEKTHVRFAWNAQGLFVHAELEDSYIVAKSREDEQLHFETGDVFELFVKPPDEDYCWEMYATPYANKSTLFFPRDRSGMNVQNFLHDHSFRGLEVSARIEDRGWVADMFVPVEQLTALGGDWAEGAAWSVLCGRYNFNNDELDNPELSMWPAVSKTNYHLTNEYARLQLCT
ncbi:carbohydrate-binding family 9-like protein [Pontiellaceae bacterium B12227]|nr:carbohydrate-binding family 9-like protein [Pontiellaceae bacterium B12227]